MGVRYCDLHDIDRGDFDAVVVGSGFAGSVMARWQSAAASVFS